jgi:excisionase family DNA binding protein
MQAATMTRSDLDRIEAKLDELLGLTRKPPAPARTHYSVEEAAEILGVTPATVRLWCRHGRIEAGRRRDKSGGASLWSVAAAEVERYKNKGPRELDPRWNQGRRA